MPLYDTPVMTDFHPKLLNTFTNLGGTWPKWFVLKGIDMFTVATCRIPESGMELTVQSKFLNTIFYFFHEKSDEFPSWRMLF